jgi:8-oxo-dGTP pyrophosphatase MutT (NUDIX family)
VLEREPHTVKTWFPPGLILPNEAHVDFVAVRELFEEASLTLNAEGLRC